MLLYESDTKYDLVSVVFVPGYGLAAANSSALLFWKSGELKVQQSLPFDHNTYGEVRLSVNSAGTRVVTEMLTQVTFYEQTKTGWVVEKSLPHPAGVVRCKPLEAANELCQIGEFVARQNSVRFQVTRTSFLKDSKTKEQSFELQIPVEFSPSHLPRRHMSDLLRATDISDDGKWLLSSCGGKAVRLWDLSGQTWHKEITLRGYPCCISFLPNSTQFLVDAGTTLYLYSLPTLELQLSIKTKYSYVPSLAFSPDNRLLARTDRSTTVRIYELASGRELTALSLKRGRLTSVAFSPDGAMVAVGTHEGKVVVWDVE